MEGELRSVGGGWVLRVSFQIRSSLTELIMLAESLKYSIVSVRTELIQFCTKAGEYVLFKITLLYFLSAVSQTRSPICRFDPIPRCLHSKEGLTKSLGVGAGVTQLSNMKLLMVAK